jgi:hypothetical protein
MQRRDSSAAPNDVRQDVQEVLERAHAGLLEQVAGFAELLVQLDLEPESSVEWHAQRAQLVDRIALGRDDLVEIERALQRSVSW